MLPNEHIPVQQMGVLIATSVVRGTRQGESHGGVYLIDLDRERIRQVLDWNRSDIDWSGRGWDRGLRGIAFDGDTVYIAASDELFAFDPDFRPRGSWRNPALRHCHEIHVHRRRLYLSSTGFDSVLGFDLDQRRFSWGMRFEFDGIGYRGAPFDPCGERLPLPCNELHLNNVFCDASGMYLGGLHLCGLLRYDGKEVRKVVPLPAGIHNARPLAEGIIYNDTASDQLCVVRGGRRLRFPVPKPDAALLEHVDADESGIARSGFARGLCLVDARTIAAGSSPSTVTLYDIEAGKRRLSVVLSRDVRNAIHGLARWPFPTT
jgi:hypothetical protein